MTVVPAKLRKIIHKRDGGYCVRCGTTTALTMQHREAVGAGGTSVDLALISPADLLLACGSCNEGFEHRLQADALRYGWKLRRNRDHELWPGDKVPFFDGVLGHWYMPDSRGGRRWVAKAGAMATVGLANGA